MSFPTIQIECPACDGTGWASALREEACLHCEGTGIEGGDPDATNVDWLRTMRWAMGRGVSFALLDALSDPEQAELIAAWKRDAQPAARKEAA